MSEQLADRLARAISTVMEEFKIGAPGAPYEDLTLTDAVLISWLAAAAEKEILPIQKDVSASLGLPKTTTASAVKRLKARGLVEQNQGAGDARSRAVSLTPAGERLANDLRNTRIGASVAILDTLPSGEQSQLVRLLEAVAGGLRRS